MDETRPTPDVAKLAECLRGYHVESDSREAADALESQSQQLQQAREIIEASLCPEHRTCPWCDDAKEWLAANPARK